MADEGNSERTRPSQYTSSKSAGGYGRRFVGNVRFPGYFSPSARWSVDGVQTID